MKDKFLYPHTGFSLNFLFRGSQWPPSYDLMKVRINFEGHLKKIGVKTLKFKETRGHGKPCPQYECFRGILDQPVCPSVQLSICIQNTSFCQTAGGGINPLPDKKILHWSKLEQIADNISKCI